jgi:hypothetical protein
VFGKKNFYIYIFYFFAQKKKKKKKKKEGKTHFKKQHENKTFSQKLYLNIKTQFPKHTLKANVGKWGCK